MVALAACSLRSALYLVVCVCLLPVVLVVVLMVL